MPGARATRTPEGRSSSRRHDGLEFGGTRWRCCCGDYYEPASLNRQRGPGDVESQHQVEQLEDSERRKGRGRCAPRRLQNNGASCRKLLWLPTRTAQIAQHNAIVLDMDVSTTHTPQPVRLAQKQKFFCSERLRYVLWPLSPWMCAGSGEQCATPQVQLGAGRLLHPCREATLRGQPAQGWCRGSTRMVTVPTGTSSPSRSLRSPACACELQ